MKGLKELPEESCFYGYNDFNNKKGHFYIGRTKFNNRFIGTPINYMYKLGITSNLNNRLASYRKQYPDFEYIKTYYIKNYKVLEQSIKEEHRKCGVELWGSEWFTDTFYSIKNFIDDVEWEIHNTYYEKRTRYYPLYLSKWKQD